MNCMVNQQVTIGWANGGIPLLSGTTYGLQPEQKVLGPITIGDDVIIGAKCSSRKGRAEP